MQNTQNKNIIIRCRLRVLSSLFKVALHELKTHLAHSAAIWSFYVMFKRSSCFLDQSTLFFVRDTSKKCWNIHPFSIITSPALQGHWGAECIPAVFGWRWAHTPNKSPIYHQATRREALTHIHSYGQLHFGQTSSDCERKSEDLLRSHKEMRRTCRLYLAGAPWVWELNRQLSCNNAPQSCLQEKRQQLIS